MKTIYLFLFFLGMFLCEGTAQSKLTTPASQYTQPFSPLVLLDTINRMTFKINDTCRISNINCIYFDYDGNHTIILDKRGIFVFVEYKFQTFINNYGTGVGQFKKIENFLVDKETKLIIIYDSENCKVIKYTYFGKFVEEFPIRKI